MRDTLTFVCRLGGLLLALLCVGTLSARGESKETKSPPGQLRFEAYLVWAATNNVSPDPKHKPVSPEIEKKLSELPLKWAHFFECNHKELDLAKGGSLQVEMSKKCKIEVRDVDGKKVEVSLIGQKGDSLIRRTQPLPIGEYFVLAGNAPGQTAWFVILKRIK